MLPEMLNYTGPSLIVNPSTVCKNHPRNMCKSSFNDLTYLQLYFLDHSGQRLRQTQTKAAAPRKRRNSDEEFVAVRLQALIPSATASIQVSFVVKHRVLNDKGTSGRWKLTDTRLSLIAISKRVYQTHFHSKSTFQSSTIISKSPMLQLSSSDPNHVIVVWETCHNFHGQQLWWASPQSSALPSKPFPSAEFVETTIVDERHFVHKAFLPSEVRTGTKSFFLIDSHVQTVLQRFPIAASEGQVTSLLLYGDNQYGAATFRHLLQHATGEGVSHLTTDLSKVNALMLLGDFVNHGNSLNEWQTYLWQPLLPVLVNGIPVILTRGNHDGESSLTHAFTDPPLVTQSYDWRMLPVQTSFIFILNSNSDPARDPWQTLWLENALSSPDVQQAAFRIIAVHLPPYTELWDAKEGYRGEPYVRQQWVQLFERYNVDLVLSGHTHAYLRGTRNGVVYTIVGGAGGMLDYDRVFNWTFFKVVESRHHFAKLQLSDCVLHFLAISAEVEIIDELRIRSKTRDCSQSSS